MVKARWLKRRREEERLRKDSDMFKIVEEVFDSITLSHVYRLESRGFIGELKGVVNSGKEARVYWGKDRRGKDIAVKIYLSFTSDFRKSIKKYILGDPRFENIPRNNLRKLIYEWTRKEYRNLVKMYRSGVAVPEPIAFSGNILVMEFLGEDGYRAPLLVEEARNLDKKSLEKIMDEVLRQVELIVCKAGLVHADLSEYNIVLWRDKVWIIDVSQAVSRKHPDALEFLERDLTNLDVFFRKWIDSGVDEEYWRRLLECLRVG